MIQSAFPEFREAQGSPTIRPAVLGLAGAYPELRYMGSKHRLLPWIFEILSGLEFKTALDPFAGSGCVAYLLKCMGKKVVASDFLAFPVELARAAVENDTRRLDGPTVKRLLAPNPHADDFIQKTFAGIFFTGEDLRFLDRISANIATLKNPHSRALAKAALVRSCLKRQPRGVFTFSGDRYNDGRRDLRLSIEEHFLEQIEVFNRIIFNNGQRHWVMQADVFEIDPKGADLVYLDPPYVPRSDDNCYVKRYHFLKGLVGYWEGTPVMEDSKVRKLPKRFTPFGYRKTAMKAFDRLFGKFRDATIVLSYSSNGFPDLVELEKLLRVYKRDVTTFERAHRYHFGTHSGVKRSSVQEYLIVGR